MTPDRTHQSLADPVLRDALVALVGFGVRMAQAATDLAEAEARVAAAVTGSLPPSTTATSMAEAHAAGLAVDAADAALAQVSPRFATARQNYERVNRAVRRTVALIQRLDAGWRPQGAARGGARGAARGTAWGGSDNRRTMARRHIAYAIGKRIPRHTDGETAERLFDDLYDRLDTLDLDGDLDRPVDELIELICRDLDLPTDPPHSPEPATLADRTTPEPTTPTDRTAPDG